MKFFIEYFISIVVSGCLSVYCFNTNNIVLGVICAVLCFLILFGVVFFLIRDAKKLGKEQLNQEKENSLKSQEKTKDNNANQEDFKWLDGKTDDLTINEVTDIEELLEDDK